jgi:acyl-CoA synthetase (AMP-forming)/AMP-acid ligase II
VAIEAAGIVGIPQNRIYAMGSSPSPKRVKCIQCVYNALVSKKSRFLTASMCSCSEASKREFESFDFPSVNPLQNVMLPFSSGTTGLPKGVALSARNMVANTMQISHVEKLGKHLLGMLSFFHIYPMMLIHVGIYQGSANVIVPRFEPESFLKVVSKYEVRSTMSQINAAMSGISSH